MIVVNVKEEKYQSLGPRVHSCLCAYGNVCIFAVFSFQIPISRAEVMGNLQRTTILLSDISPLNGSIYYENTAY